MKANKIVLLNPPVKWSPSFFRQVVIEFTILFFTYIVLNLLSSYLHDIYWKNELNMGGILNEDITNSIFYKMGKFPYSSLISVVLISLFLLLCFMSRKISMWLLSERDSDYKKILSLELVSVSIFLLFLIIVILYSFMIILLNNYTYLEYFLIVNSLFSLSLLFIVLHIYRYIKYSKFWFSESPSKAFLIYLTHFISIYLFIKIGF
jgi:hypothetical protein